jgi:hypothetical protein
MKMCDFCGIRPAYIYDDEMNDHICKECEAIQDQYGYGMTPEMVTPETPRAYDDGEEL